VRPTLRGWIERGALSKNWRAEWDTAIQSARIPSRQDGEANLIEVTAVAIFFGLLGALGAVFLLPWQVLGIAGLWIVGIGVMVGVPAGIAWHVALYLALHPRGLLHEGWYWRPMDLHDLLEPGEARPILALCYLGAAGFFAILFGAMLLLGAAVEIWAHHM